MRMSPDQADRILRLERHYIIYSRKSPHPCHCAYVYHYQLLPISNSQPTLL